jgi:Uma2 family endonuclease
MTTRSTLPPRNSIPSRPPPLENGDRLAWSEFNRRWEAMPHVKKAELINGVVHMPAALRHEQHGRPHMLLSALLGTYALLTPGVDFSDNATLILDGENAPQPDLLLRIDPAAGGRSHIDADGYLEGPPELIAEVAASSASIDLNAKLAMYQRHGVPEYLVWRVLDGALDWFVLRHGAYAQLPASEGILRSAQFPGLWLDPINLVRLDGAPLLDLIRRGCASPEHSAFVTKLRATPPASAD